MKKSEFSIDFSMARSPNRVLTPLKSASKIRIFLLFLLPKSSFGRDKFFRMCDFTMLSFNVSQYPKQE
jgi:hypothetical protein